jgi:hypothetical protein
MSWPGLILGQAQPSTTYQQIERLGDGFRAAPANNELFTAIMGSVGLLAVLGLVLYCFGRRRRQKTKPRPNYLAEAGRILGLSHEERRSLKRLAARAQLAHPVAMLLSPANLAHALQRSTSGTGDAMLQSRVEALSVRLFGQLPPSASEPAGATPAIEPRRRRREPDQRSGI